MTKVQIVLLFALLLHAISLTVGELRWCKILNSSSMPTQGTWMRYDDATQICLTCSEKSSMLLEANEVDKYECCGGIIASARSCSSNLKNGAANCSNTIKCDGKKQCARGLDELGCSTCPRHLFACQNEKTLVDSTNDLACLLQMQVCDSKKNCRNGLDESGCLWHEGWCNGFLCKNPNARCIPLSQVCDGTKQCIDGSDEFNCLYCDNQFRCMEFERNSSAPIADSRNTRTAQCIGNFRVCDGKRDCFNNLDETNCFRWREWSLWSECLPPDVCSRTRTRACVNGRSSEEVDVENCYDVDDYHKGSGARLLETHTDLCPTCVPTQSLTAKPSTTTVVDSTSHRFRTSTSKPVSLKRSTTKSQTVTTATKSIHLSTLLSFNMRTFTSVSTTLQNSVMDTPRSNNRISNQSFISKENKIDGLTTSHTNTSQSYNEKSPAPAALAVIIAASIIAGALLLTMVFCLAFCLTEKRYKTGKWTPRKFRKNQTIKVPDMYYDIPISENGTLESNLPTSQKPTEQQVMSTFSGLNSTIDSGIDANSTSSAENDHHHRENYLTTDFVNSPHPCRSRQHHAWITEEQDFPPPPPNVTS